VDRLCAGPLCKAIIAPSAQMRDTLVRVHRVAPEKVAVVHHGFELDELDPAVVDGTALRRELGLEGRTVLTAIGRYYWIKNQEALVRAFATVAPEAEKATLVLVGGGERKPLQVLARSLGIDDRVRILPARQDVPEVLAATDLFVHPALAESFGMVIVEAMAMGCPVVSTPVGIAPDLVESGVTGVFAADGSEHALALALREALSIRDRWPVMGNAARERSLEFSAAKMVACYEALYRRLLGHRGLASPEEILAESDNPA
jgi:glycosyltransferase involved in cell wall biosynthesis